MTTDVNVNLGPAVVNLVGIVENDDWAIAIALTAGGDPYDLTAAVISAKLKTKTTSYPLTAVVTDALGGLLTVSQADAPTLPGGSRWALRINARTLLAGTVTGIGDVLE